LWMVLRQQINQLRTFLINRAKRKII